MSMSITVAQVQQYKGEVTQLVQQKMSKFRAAVREEPQVGKNAFYDQIDTTTAAKLTTRHAPTVTGNITHARRRVSLVDYQPPAELIDDEDRFRILFNPQNAYAVAQAASLNRATDDEIIAAALGTAYTGETGSTTVAFPSSQQIASGSIGMTRDKVIATLEAFNLADVDPDEEKYYAIGPKQVSDLLKLTEVGSADYNNVKALVEGKVTKFMGFTFIMSNRLLVNGVPERRCFAWTKMGICLGVASDIYVDIGPRRDLNNAMQVLSKITIGAARMQEKLVVECPCLES